MKRLIVLAGGIVATMTLITVMVVGWSVGRGAGVAAAPRGTLQASAAVPSTGAHYSLSIDTPAMLGGSEETGPAYVPAAFTLPANSDVTLTITNFDGATALPAGSEQYATASGIKGPLAIQAIDSANPNGEGATRTATSLDPATEMSHTFTILKLGINVPLAPMSRTTFTFHTGDAGSYDWRCMDPCGNGPAGWGAAMAASGYMQGKVTFA